MPLCLLGLLLCLFLLLFSKKRNRQKDGKKIDDSTVTVTVNYFNLSQEKLIFFFLTFLTKPKHPFKTNGSTGEKGLSLACLRVPRLGRLAPPVVGGVEVLVMETWSHGVMPVTVRGPQLLLPKYCAGRGVMLHHMVLASPPYFPHWPVSVSGPTIQLPITKSTWVRLGKKILVLRWDSLCWHQEHREKGLQYNAPPHRTHTQTYSNEKERKKENTKISTFILTNKMMWINGRERELIEILLKNMIVI